MFTRDLVATSTHSLCCEIHVYSSLQLPTLCKDWLKLASHSLDHSLRQLRLVYHPTPFAYQASSIRRVDDLLYAEGIGSPDGIHKAAVGLFQLFVPRFARVETLLLLDLPQLRRVADVYPA